MIGKLQHAGTVESLSAASYWFEDYLAYYYAGAKASGKLLRAPRTPHP
jgi:hypothetical protein